MMNKITFAGNNLEMEYLHHMMNNTFVTLIIDQEGKVVHANDAYFSLTGYHRHHIIGRLLPVDITQQDLLEKGIARIKESGGSWRGEISHINNKKELLWLDVTLTPLHSTMNGIFCLGMICFDITRQVNIRERLYLRVQNDFLTRVLNRHGYYLQSRKKVRQANRDNQRITVAILDIDDFKVINDRLGHAAGDEVLRCFSGRIKEVISEQTIFGRLGGDEFALTFVEGCDEDSSIILAQRILNTIREPIYLQSALCNVDISASIGLVSYPCSGGNFSSAIRSADAGLYQVKINGGNNYYYNVL